MRRLTWLFTGLVVTNLHCLPVTPQDEEQPAATPTPEPEPDPGPDPGPGPDPTPDPGPEPDPPPGDPPIGNQDFWGIIDQKCLWCHTAEHPTADFNFETRSIPSHRLDEFVQGVQHELAPFVEKLTTQEKQILLDWARERGANIPPVTIPQTFSWNMNAALGGLQDGSPAPGFAFIIEDGFIDEQAWTVRTYTDRHGTTYKGVALDQQRQVDQSVFSSSRNPSSYLVFGDAPFHGRFYDGRLEGDVRVGRWMSVGMHAERMSPTGRDHRRYVRLQFDRDSICLRSAPMELETWPWGDRSDPRLEGNNCVSGFYQTSNEWLHFVLEAQRTAEGTVWTAVVSNPATGEQLANFRALERGSHSQGTFFLHAYSTGDDRQWANLEFETRVDTSN